MAKFYILRHSVPKIRKKVSFVVINKTNMKKTITIVLISAIASLSCLSQSFEQGEFTGFSIGDPELYDINNDDKVDVIGLEQFGFGSIGDLVIYINKSLPDSIAFDMEELGIRGIGAPAVADMDGDNDLDIVVSEWDGSNSVVIILYNEGNLQFTKDTISTESLYRHSIADLDGDNDLDIVSTNRDNNFMRVNINQGDGEFLQSLSLQRDDLYDVSLNDFDNDGDTDIIVGFDDFFDSYFIMWSNNGNGDFAEQNLFLSPFGNLVDFKITDVDKNGLNDIVFFGRNSGSLRVILQKAIGMYEEQALLNAPNAISGFSISNFDSKNSKDVLLGGDNQADITFHLSQGMDPFDFADLETVSTISPARFFEPSDLDGDGDLDVVVSNGDFWWLENRLEQGTVDVMDIEEISLNVYPNPFDQEIFIDDMKQEHSIEIFNSIGDRIFKVDSPIQKLDLSNYNTGIYYLRISNKNNLLKSTYSIIKK